MALLTSEIKKIKAELGYPLEASGAEPYIGIVAVFEQVIQEFIDGGDHVRGYFRGISLLYYTNVGLTKEEDVKSLYSKTIKETVGETWEDYQDKIQLLWHPGPNKGTIQINWAQNL